MDNLIAEYQDKMNRLNAIASVFQRADRIITRDSELVVNVVDNPELGTNATSDGREITLNGDKINDISDDNILHLYGLNFHEVGHVLFSPRMGSDLMRYVKENRLRRAITLLEEARSEAMLTAKYPSTRLFLEASFMEYIGKQDDLADYFPLTTGRTYLPIEIRQAISDKFIAKRGLDLAQKLHTIIHEYRTLVFPTDFDKAKQLVMEMANLIGTDDEPIMDFPIPEHSGQTKGRPLGKADQEATQNKVSNTPTDMESMSEPSGNASGDPTDSDKAIAEAITKRVSEIKQDSEVKQRVNETRKAILEVDGTRDQITKHPNGMREAPVSTKSLTIARQFAQELERIVRDSDPAWNKFNARGKLNITRTMNPDVNAIRTHFDQWDTGNPNTDIEAVVLADRSGSMFYNMSEVMEATWILKRSIESIEGSVTAYTYDDNTNLLYSKSDKAKPSVFNYAPSGGNTNPLEGLIEAERILTSSKRSLKLAFIVTDGEWGNEDECNKIIKSLNDKGIVTCLVFLTSTGTLKDLLKPEMAETLSRMKHGVEVFQAVTESKQMLSVAQNLVRSMMKQVA